MTKLLIVSKNENGLIEMTEETFRLALEDAQKEAYNEGFQLGYLKGQSTLLLEKVKELSPINNKENVVDEC